jgi:hypothetical protein
MKLNRKNVFGHMAILALFSNVLLFSHNAVGGRLTGESISGPRDRIRKFKEGGSNSGIQFKYNLTSGFSCNPGELKFFTPSEAMSGDSEEYSDDVNDLIRGGNYALSLIINIILSPILCVSTLSAFGNAVAGNGITAALETLVRVRGLNSLSYLEDLIYDEDDYNLDMYNPSCLGITISMFVSCIVMAIVWQLPLDFLNKLIVVASISTIVQVAKEIIKGVQFYRATKAFEKLSLCGDNWYTYGGIELEEDLNAKSNRNSDYIVLNDLRQNFPAKGSFFGSYSYKLNSCFKDRDIDVCKSMLGLESIASEDLDRYFSVSYNQ